MANIAIILAGGVGKRTGQDVPKQFVTINEKPILIYTLEAFENHAGIDAIEVVCLEGWHDILWAYAKQFNITKLRWIINGGTSSHESIKCGIDNLKDKCNPEDVIIIHDGVRPLLDDYVLSDLLVKCNQYGNAVTSMPYNEQIFLTKDGETTTEYIQRETIRRVSTPQAYTFNKLVWAYDKAFKEKIGLHNSAYVNTLMVELGETLHFSAGSDKNIKLTTKDDLEIFKGLLYMRDKKWYM